MLEKSIAAKGLPLEPLQAYIDSMRYGMPPHGLVRGRGRGRVSHPYP